MSYVHTLPAGTYEIGKLSGELDAAGHTHNRITSFEGTTVVEFAVEPDQPTKDAVDAIAAAHDDTVREYQLYQYAQFLGMDPTIPPLGIDYKTGLDRRLHPEMNFVKGELQYAIYYENCTLDPETGQKIFDTPVLRVDFVWMRDPETTFVYLRISTICYYFTDGTVDTDPNHAKVMQKFYANDESIKEGIRRRSNIVDSLKLINFGLLEQVYPDYTRQNILDLGRQWLEEYSDTLYNYIDAGDIVGLQDRMANDTTYWMRAEIPGMGITIAQFLINEVDI